jgi:hypothetical protein
MDHDGGFGVLRDNGGAADEGAQRCQRDTSE